METTNEEHLFKNRIKEIAMRSYKNNIFTFTPFLNLSEINWFYEIVKDIKFIDYKIFGGLEISERQMIRFGSFEMFDYEEEFPITTILIEPQAYKFAQVLTHRDYLGALMNLGIERNVIGDIILNDKLAYVFCLDKMADYIIENIDKTKHTSVKCKKLDYIPDIIKPKLMEVKISVSSMRCDNIIAKVYNLSRSQSLKLFQEKRICINGKDTENNDTLLKEGDVVSVRGYGKFISHEASGLSKKGKLYIEIEKYI